ncbi:ribosome maturation factor RimM [Hansschlegelia plantiphila]|uniref:Ribosome maturation factor RimM n=1 Tax=Hansschlegelia plantiphila TaxID=374655 RepID=A0A9W6MVY6_9HYPH|nr:ribosome maturation factor RimM [Hansschlegelia plantiphila]GLK68949.1 ribosome maturation factor RimM [Hansschlegelia plantiphila]
MPLPRLVQIGVIGAAHGVRGELRVKSFTGEPAALARYGELSDPSGGRSFAVESFRPLKDDMLVVRFRGIATREAAEALTGTGLFLPREALPDSGDEDEFYHADLIGLRVESPDGTPLGEVVALQNFGADDLMEIRLADERRTVYLPFTKAVVPVVDVAGGRVVVDPPDGALDESGPETAA